MSEADVASVHAIIANSELRGIEYYEISAKRAEGAPSATDGPDEAQLSITVQQRHDENSFGVRLVSKVAIELGTVTASVAGEYNLLNGHQPTVRALQLFTNEVGIMTVFPYLREAIATATARVFGQAMQLPIMQRGQVAVDVDAALE